MDIGISLSSTTTQPAGAAAHHLIRRARAAATAGLASMTLGDSHVVDRAGYFQNTPALGRLLAEWSGRPAGCLFLLPMWPPVLVAEQVGTLAALHDGPFIVQTGIGGAPAQFAALGAPTDRRVTVFEEQVRIVQALLAGDAVSSELFGFDEVRLGLVPEQPIEWWMGTMASAGVRRAARFGAAWYAAPGAAAASLTPLAVEYRAACDEFGTAPRVMVRRDALVLADGDRARELAGAAVERGYRGMRIDQLLVGDPTDAADQLAEYAAAGFDQIVVRTMGVDPDVDVETIESMAEVRSLIG